MVSSLLEVKDLTVHYGDKLILKNINFTVGRGEFHVLLGPNGTGKSSLLRTIMGLTHGARVEGKILFEGMDITRVPIYERASMGISLMFQHPPSFDGLRVRDLVDAMILKFGDKLGGVFSVDEFLDRELFKNFSGGEKKKVELFISSLQNPKLLMLDEPDSGVDIENIKYIGEHIDYLLESGVSILLVTHQGFIFNYIEKEPSKAHVLLNGSIALTGNPNEIISVIMENGYKRGLELLVGVD